MLFPKEVHDAVCQGVSGQGSSPDLIIYVVIFQRLPCGDMTNEWPKSGEYGGMYCTEDRH